MAMTRWHGSSLDIYTPSGVIMLQPQKPWANASSAAGQLSYTGAVQSHAAGNFVQQGMPPLCLFHTSSFLCLQRAHTHQSKVCMQSKLAYSRVNTLATCYQ